MGQCGLQILHARVKAKNLQQRNPKRLKMEQMNFRDVFKKQMGMAWAGETQSNVLTEFYLSLVCHYLYIAPTALEILSELQRSEQKRHILKLADKYRFGLML